VQFGAFYRLSMKAVVVAGSARKIAQCWWRVLAMTLVCQRRDDLVISVSGTAIRRLSALVRMVEGAELSQKASDFEDVGVSLEL
jgi:hypothetical protein